MLPHMPGEGQQGSWTLRCAVSGSPARQDVPGTHAPQIWEEGMKSNVLCGKNERAPQTPLERM